MTEYENGAKALFDVLQGMAASPYDFRPEAIKKHDIESEIVLRWLNEAYEEVCPENARTWRELSKVCIELENAQKAIVEAVQREREACAKVCDEQELSLTIDKDWPDQVAHRCAVAIRNRSNE